MLGSNAKTIPKESSVEMREEKVYNIKNVHYIFIILVTYINYYSTYNDVEKK